MRSTPARPQERSNGGRAATQGALARRTLTDEASPGLGLRGLGSSHSAPMTGVAIRASSPTDDAATKTIDRLGLNHALMNQFRKAVIEATLGIRGRGHASLDLHSARARLNGLRTAEQSRSPLEPFCFVLKQALQRHITRVEAIRRSKRELR